MNARKDSPFPDAQLRAAKGEVVVLFRWRDYFATHKGGFVDGNIAALRGDPVVRYSVDHFVKGMAVFVETKASRTFTVIRTDIPMDDPDRKTIQKTLIELARMHFGDEVQTENRAGADHQSVK